MLCCSLSVARPPDRIPDEQPTWYVRGRAVMADTGREPCVDAPRSPARHRTPPRPESGDRGERELIISSTLLEEI